MVCHLKPGLSLQLQAVSAMHIVSSRRRGGSHRLAWQMIGERLLDRPVAPEGGDVRRLCRSSLGGQILFDRVGLQIFEFSLHLRKKPAGAFGIWAELLAPELDDLHLSAPGSARPTSRWLSPGTGIWPAPLRHLSRAVRPHRRTAHRAVPAP